MSRPARLLAAAYLLAAVLIVAGVATYTPGAAAIVAGLLIAGGATAVLRDWTPEESER